MFTRIYYHIYSFKDHKYVVGATEKGLSFVGSRDQGLEEIRQFYSGAKLVDAEQMVNKYANQIGEYLEGERQEFTLKLDVSGTKFQESVWKQLKKIPYGKTNSYTEIAQAIGNPKAVRAVGSAIGKNPVLIVVPCHRVITKDQQLGNYRGGLAMKRELLTLEGAIDQ